METTKFLVFLISLFFSFAVFWIIFDSVVFLNIILCAQNHLTSTLKTKKYIQSARSARKTLETTKNGSEAPENLSYLYLKFQAPQDFQKIGPRRNFGLAETLWGGINSNWLVRDTIPALC